LESGVCAVAHPGDVSVGPDQHGAGSRNFPKCGELPRTCVGGVNYLNPIRPSNDVELAGLTELEEHRSRSVHQREDPRRAVGGGQIEIGYAASEQWVPIAEVVVNVQTGHHRGESLARLVHAQQLGHAFAQRLDAVVGA